MQHHSSRYSLFGLWTILFPTNDSSDHTLSYGILLLSASTPSITGGGGGGGGGVKERAELPHIGYSDT